MVLAGLFLMVPGLVFPTYTKIFLDNVLMDGYTSWLRPLLLAMGITALATDPDITDTVSYSVDDARFTIDPAGVVRVAAGASFDAETEGTINLSLPLTNQVVDTALDATYDAGHNDFTFTGSRLTLTGGGAVAPRTRSGKKAFQPLTPPKKSSPEALW